jgi:hypothetical protein
MTGDVSQVFVGGPAPDQSGALLHIQLFQRAAGVEGAGDHGIRPHLVLVGDHREPAEGGPATTTIPSQFETVQCF